MGIRDLGISSVSVGADTGPADCGLNVFITETVDGVGWDGSGDSIKVNVVETHLETSGLFFLSC
jgi:hypothetical protein